jgi:hypothetical protein
MLDKLTITLGQEEITGKHGRTVQEGLVRAKHWTRDLQDTSDRAALCIAAALVADPSNEGVSINCDPFPD